MGELHVFEFGQLNIWPSRSVVDDSMPEDFQSKYPNTRAIIDCTEIKCQMPSSLLLNSEFFSTYKNHTTLKALVAISPAGHISFISQLYTVSISDREITEKSGFLHLLLMLMIQLWQTKVLSSKIFFQLVCP